jgi:Mg-chelatase subunit ChlD
MSTKTWITLAVALFFALGSAPSPAAAQEGGGSGAPKQNLDLPYDAGGEDEEEEEAPEIVVFYGQQYEGDGIFFCCDKSGSMKEGTKWKKLQQEVVKNINQFSERVQFSLVFFDAQLVKFPTSGRPADASPAMKMAGIAMVMSTKPGSGTCTLPALLTSLDFANQSSAKRKVIIYLSDGFQHCPGNDATAYGQNCLATVTSYNTGGVHINTICIGANGQVDEAWMRKLAAQNNGSYARIDG